MSQQTWRGRIARSAPPVVRDWVAATRLRRIRQRNATRSAQDVFSEIYAAGRWGGWARTTREAADGETPRRGTAATSATGSPDRRPYGGRPRVAATSRWPPSLWTTSTATTAWDISWYRSNGTRRSTAATVSRSPCWTTTAACGRPMSVSYAVGAATPFQRPDHPDTRPLPRLPPRCGDRALAAPRAARLPNVDKPHGPDTRLDSGSGEHRRAALQLRSRGGGAAGAGRRCPVPAGRDHRDAVVATMRPIMTPSVLRMPLMAVAAALMIPALALPTLTLWTPGLMLVVPAVAAWLVWRTSMLAALALAQMSLYYGLTGLVLRKETQPVVVALVVGWSAGLVIGALAVRRDLTVHVRREWPPGPLAALRSHDRCGRAAGRSRPPRDASASGRSWRAG